MSIPKGKLPGTGPRDGNGQVKTSRVRSETMGGLAKRLAIIDMFGAGYAQLTVADAACGFDTTRAPPS